MKYVPVKGVFKKAPLGRSAIEFYEGLGPEADLAARILVSMAGDADIMQAGIEVRELASKALNLACALYQGARDRGLMVNWPVGDEAPKVP